jgi:hypothetical protein
MTILVAIVTVNLSGGEPLCLSGLSDGHAHRANWNEISDGSSAPDEAASPLQVWVQNRAHGVNSLRRPSLKTFMDSHLDLREPRWVEFKIRHAVPYRGTAK